MKLKNSTLRVVVTSVWMTLGLVIFVISARMENPIGQPIGPGYVPSIIAGCLLVAGAFCLAGDIKRLRQAKKSAVSTNLKPAGADPAAWGELRVLALVGLAYAAVFVWHTVGYIIATSAITWAMILIDRKFKLGWGFLFSVFTALSLWLIFSVALKVELG